MNNYFFQPIAYLVQPMNVNSIFQKHFIKTWIVFSLKKIRFIIIMFKFNSWVMVAD